MKFTRCFPRRNIFVWPCLLLGGCTQSSETPSYTFTGVQDNTAISKTTRPVKDVQPFRAVRSGGQVRGDLKPETLPGKGWEESRKERVQAWSQLNHLWAQRKQKDINPEVLRLAQHPLNSVKLPAVKMLGHLENPNSLEVLEQLNKQLPHKFNLMVEGSEGSGVVSPLAYAVPLAIGRIKAKNLTGRAKLNTILREIGLDFDTLAQFTAQASKEGVAAHKAGNQVVEEILDVLYQQKKKGEDIAPLTKQLELRPGQKLLLQDAGLPVKEEATHLLEYLSR